MSIGKCSPTSAKSEHICSQIRYAGIPEYQLEHWPLVVDMAACRVFYDGKLVHMNLMHLRVLIAILLNKHRPVHRDEIEAELYGFEHHTNVISVYVNKINRQIEGAGAPGKFIIGEYGKGYRLARGAN